MSTKTITTREVLGMVAGLKTILYATPRTKRHPTEILRASIETYGEYQDTKQMEVQARIWGNDVRDEILCKNYSLRDFLHFQICRMIVRDIHPELFMKTKALPKKYGVCSPYLLPFKDEEATCPNTSKVVRSYAKQFTNDAVAHDTEILKRVIAEATNPDVKRFVRDFPILGDTIHHSYATRPIVGGKSLLWLLLEEKVIGHGLYFQVLRSKPADSSIYNTDNYRQPEVMAWRFASLTKTTDGLSFIE